MSGIKETIRRTFDAAAEQFDEIGTPFFKYYGESLADFAGVKPDDRILDIACGRGATTFPLLKKISPKGKIVAIDISEKMIEACRKQMQQSETNPIEFQVMDAEHLLIDDESIDRVICGFGLFFLPDIEQGLSEIKRVLKPGGLLAFSSWNEAYRLQWLNEIILKYVPESKKQVSVNSEKLRDTDFLTLSGIDKILDKSGFIKKQVIINNLDCFYRDEEEWIESRWQTAFRMNFEKLSEEDYHNFKSEMIENLQSYKVDGKIKITMSAILTKAIK